MTTNNGPAVLFRNDQTRGNRSLRLRSAWAPVESRRHRRHRPHLSRRHVAVADGEERLQLSLAVRAAGDLRRRPARSRRSRRHQLAERPHRGVQERRHRHAPTTASKARESPKHDSYTSSALLGWLDRESASRLPRHLRDGHRLPAEKRNVLITSSAPSSSRPRTPA